MEKQSFKGVPESNWVVGPCQTEEIAKQVLAVAHAYGWKWRSGLAYIEKTDYDKITCYNLSEGKSSSVGYYKSESFTIISPETFLANNPMPKEKPEEKTRKPGVKYTLEDWKKESEANRKKAEYWKNKFQVSDKTANTVADSMTEVLKTHEKLKLDLDTTSKNYTILQTENKALKESNVELRGANEALTKDGIQLAKEKHEALDELKTVKSHLELRTKGIQALEEDAAKYRMEISLLKSDFETKNSELEFLEEDYNCLKDIQKYTKVVGWVGWIGMILCMAFIMFYKG